jgi:alpha-ketoglutaric semialdehyde dehydrogenase
MSVTGVMFIAGEPHTGGGGAFQAHDAATGEPLAPTFHTADPTQMDAALARAEAAAFAFADSAPSRRAELLDAIAAAVAATGEALVLRTMEETGLPRQRVEGERIRTVNQLRLFAELLRQGEFASVRIDRADPTRDAGPKPDLRLAMLALGPVAVFGASNFPLAFSVAGGDTASAFAAGCPVIVKGHPAHPGTAEIIARAVSEGVTAAGFDPGIFSLLHDGGFSVGEALVADARIKAVGFTGSRAGGEALLRIAATRPEPIPVYAEMSAINPVVLCPARLEEAAELIATSFVASLTLGTGQFCTNPGLVIGIDSTALDRFAAAAATALHESPAGIMLTPGIRSGFNRACDALAACEGVAVLAAREPVDGRASARLFVTSAQTFIGDPALHHEMFGPAALLVRCHSIEEVEQVLASVEGQLTVALHFKAADHALVERLLPLVRRKAGRVLANGFGTGVEVSPAMVHGGPWPASSDSRTTSVGTLAIARFLRPVCLQDFPQDLLPNVVRDANPWGVPQTVV